MHIIINKNSNSETDKKLKTKAWNSIKKTFDTQCRVDGVYVSIGLCRSLIKFLNIQANCRELSTSTKSCGFVYTKVEDRTIAQLQSKYKDLKKNVRQIVSKVKRDIAQTGNMPLQKRTVRALSLDSNAMLLALRKQIGPTATGFQSKFGEY